MKRFILFLTIFGLTLGLVGCGSANQTSTDNVKNGLNKLLASSQDLKKAIEDGNDDQVKKIGPSLEDEWSSFEDDIKPKYPDSYEEVEKYLDPAIAGSKITPVDKKTLTPLVDHLIKAVQDLSNKLGK